MKFKHSYFRVDPEDASVKDLLDQILDKGIVLDPSAKILLGVTDLRATQKRLVVAPERRRRPFVVPHKNLPPAGHSSRKRD